MWRQLLCWVHTLVVLSMDQAEIARLQGTREGKQELMKAATRPDGGAVREGDAEPEVLGGEEMELRDGTCG
jgi:hypothetical protein